MRQATCSRQPAKPVHPPEESTQRLEVTLDTLFCEAFMREHTQFASISDFFLGGGFSPGSLMEIEALPANGLDFHTAGTTHFSTWHEMLENAVDELLLRMNLAP